MFCDKIILICLSTCVSLIANDFPNKTSSRKMANNNNLNYSLNINLTPNSDLHLANKFAPYYFGHLTDNFPTNTNESCVYIAASMLLSFYDTYWDDSIISQNYESNPTTLNNESILETKSPGVSNEYDDWITYFGNYENFIEDYYQTYFHMLLLHIEKSRYGHYEYALNHFGTYYLLHDYIYDYRNYGPNNVNLIYSPVNVRNEVIYYVSQGIPVILGLEKPGEVGGHAVVAYDYDSTEDKIYCHFGWHENKIHVTPESQGYTIYTDYVGYNFLSTHSHTHNYVDSNNNSICPCSLIHITNVTVENLYLDLPPTFKWLSFYDEKWYGYQNLYFVVSILDMNNSLVRTVSEAHDTQCTFSLDDLTYAVNVPGRNFKLCIEITSNSYPYWDEYIVTTVFPEPDSYYFKTQIKPNQWGFEPRYYFANEGVRTTTYYANDITLYTSRLRCGYIENSYVVLSARRENAGLAYFELTFDQPVYSFLASVSLWSDNENIDGTCLIKTKASYGVWNTDANLLTDYTLPTRTSIPLRIPFIHNEGIYGIRFEVTASAVGDRNKGRLCIDDIVLSTTSGTLNNLYYILNYCKTN